MKYYLAVNILIYFLGLLTGIYNCIMGRKSLAETQLDAAIGFMMAVWSCYFLF